MYSLNSAEQGPPSRLIPQCLVLVNAGGQGKLCWQPERMLGWRGARSTAGAGGAQTRCRASDLGLRVSQAEGRRPV